jgi:4-amino-4-deoxy-L-arabinose transferase-like glycosyltransferase
MSPTDAASGTTVAERRWALAILAAVTVACLAPFLNKAYCIDDPLFLWAGRHIQSHPLDFFGFEVNWAGFVEPMYENTKNPPFGCFYIALAAALVGWSEPALHAAFLLPAIGTIWGTWYVARRLCGQPVAAALAALATPVFLVSSTNVMCDTLALCGYVWAIAFWLTGLTSNKLGWLVISSILVAVSTLTKYFGVSLIPLLAAYTLWRNPRDACKLAALLIPVGILAAYQWWTWRQYGRGLLLDAALFATETRETTNRPLWAQSLTMLCYCGGCLLPVAFCAPWAVRGRWIGAAALLGAVSAMAVFLAKPDVFRPFRTESPFHSELAVQIGTFCAIGLLAIWLSVADVFRRRDASSILLFLWIVGTAVFAGFVNWTCNGRSILPMAPAMGILLVRAVEDRGGDSSARRLRWMWGLAPALGVALAVAWADYWFAESARTATQRIFEFCGRSQRTVWLEGHWGFQYYMEAAGGRSVDFNRPVFRRRDFLAMPSNNSATRVPSKQLGTVLRVVEAPLCNWLTTWDPDVGAGFYASFDGPMPFVFGSFPPELFSIFQIRTDVEVQE